MAEIGPVPFGFLSDTPELLQLRGKSLRLILFGLFGEPLSQTAQTMLPRWGLGLSCSCRHRGLPRDCLTLTTERCPGDCWLPHSR